MSTRSGKRIHGSFHESDVNEDKDVSKCEKKSRKKHSKENIEETIISVLKSKKRVNYVTYPTDDEPTSDMTVNNEDKGRTTRSLRKNALKEHNMVLPETYSLNSTKDSKIPKRNARRTKKFAENGVEGVPEPERITVGDVVVKPSTKKGKKKKLALDKSIADPDSVPNRKSKRKKKRSSIIVEEIHEPKTSLNKSNMSVDSFHSAAGSPVKCNATKNKNKDQRYKPATEDSSEYNVPCSSNTEPTVKPERSITPTPEKEKRNYPNRNSGKKRAKSGVTVEEIIESTAFCNTTKDTPTTMKESQELVSSDISKEISNKKTKRKRSHAEHNNAEPFVFNSTEVAGMANDVKNSSLNKTEVNATHEIDTEKPVSAKKRKSLSKPFEYFESTANNGELRKRKSSLKDNMTFSLSATDFNSTYEKEVLKMDGKERKSSIIEAKNSTFDKNEISTSKVMNSTFDRLSNGLNVTYETKNTNLSTDRSPARLNSTYDNAPKVTGNTTLELESETSNNTFDRTKPDINIQPVVLNSTFEKAKPKSLDLDGKINSTFDKSSKSSLLTSDDTDKDLSHVSLTSDESHENIINTTPVLIESSLDNTQLDVTKTESPRKAPVTPLKREGTFTKESSDVPQVSLEKTPQKRFSLPSPGCTPFHPSSNKERPIMNVTRSIEKASSRMSLAEVAPRNTKVMFCSPVNNPAVVMQQKRKVIKSNLKGSNKSFVFEDKEPARAGARKRSYTLNDADDARAKRKRLADDMQQSVDRLSRPRTSSATAKLVPSSPSKKPTTPSKAKPSRTKLPNFAILHQKQFDKMESLDECQERKAKRAKKLLTPTGLVDRSIRGPTTNDTPQKEIKPDMSTQLPNLESLKTGYTRFGFKLNMDVNPFSIPSKNTEVKPKEKRPNGLTRQATLPSLAGTTSLRREAAKQMVLREKSFTDKRSMKRNENRTIIKGVRTNRRFELQMKMRNID